jgi:UDP-GlcNAc:undecaprenyl-phosphate GlcNAc-1-phosphate transferase
LITTNTVGNPTGSKFFDAAITVFWIVGICNSINFFDNLDGGASGTVAISSLALFILAFNGNQFLIAALSVVIAGSTFGFLLWNKSPARIYMGDAGALFLGILIASLTIRLKPEIESSAASLVIPILLLAVPILDTSVAVISRISRGISPLTGGKDHLSHRLMNCGLTKKNTAYALWTLTLLFSATSILIQKIPNSYFDFVVSLASLFWLFLFLKFIRIKI